MYQFEYKIKSKKQINDIFNGHLILNIGGYGCPLDNNNSDTIIEFIKSIYQLDEKDKVIITRVERYLDTIPNDVTDDWKWDNANNNILANLSVPKINICLNKSEDIFNKTKKILSNIRLCMIDEETEITFDSNKQEINVKNIQLCGYDFGNSVKKELEYEFKDIKIDILDVNY